MGRKSCRRIERFSLSVSVQTHHPGIVCSEYVKYLRENSSEMKMREKKRKIMVHLVSRMMRDQGTHLFRVCPCPVSTYRRARLWLFCFVWGWCCCLSFENAALASLRCATQALVSTAPIRPNITAQGILEAFPPKQIFHAGFSVSMR